MTICKQCKREVEDKHDLFTLKIELYPAVEPSLEITSDDLESDFQAEYERLIEIMNQMGEKDVAKQEKLVYLSHNLSLCPDCRHHVAQMLEQLKTQTDHPGQNPHQARRN